MMLFPKRAFLSSTRWLSKSYSTHLKPNEARESNDGVERKCVTEENQFELLSEVVTPLANLEYPRQLKIKKMWCYEVVKRIKTKDMPKIKTTVHTIIPSPITDHYRNKDEFSIRCGVDGDPKTVGYFIGKPSEGKTVCVQPMNLKNLKPHHTDLAMSFQEFIRQSPLRACHDLHDGGFWKSIVIRSNLKGDTMAVVNCHPGGASESDIETAKIQIVEHFRKFNLSSLYLQLSRFVRGTHEMAPYELLEGDPYIYEWIGEYKFRISPDSFFQINPDAALLLYDRVVNFTDPAPQHTLLDLCCGTGTISIFASKQFRGCVGIESISHTIEDANFNADSNKVYNCHFTLGLIEKKLKTILNELEMCPELPAVLNPGRSGCHQNAIKIIRQSQQIRKLVYVSCQADHPNTRQNFINLCHPGRSDWGPPFCLTDVQPVDMFPQTKHCELILVFQR